MFVIFQKSALPFRLYADGLGVRSCPILCVRAFTGVGSGTTLCLHVFVEGLTESSPPENTLSVSGTLWAYATCVPGGWTHLGDAGGVCKESNTFSSLPGQSEHKQWFLGRTMSLTPHQVAFEVVVSMFEEKVGAPKTISTQKWIPVFPVLWKEDYRGQKHAEAPHKGRKLRVIHHPKQMIPTQHMELEPRPEGQVCAEAGNLYIPTYKNKQSLNHSAVFPYKQGLYNSSTKTNRQITFPLLW